MLIMQLMGTKAKYIHWPIDSTCVYCTLQSLIVQVLDVMAHLLGWVALQ